MTFTFYYRYTTYFEEIGCYEIVLLATVSYQVQKHMLEALYQE